MFSQGKVTLSVILISAIFVFGCNSSEKSFLKISVTEYRDKMKAAWVGQMAGVGWGLPTEFDYTDRIIPQENVPQWQADMVNQQGNDDLYVEMTFLASMDQYGIEVPIRQAGIDFANTGYTLWAANKAGRENLRYGIAPPASSHPRYSNNCDDIDYQIEADFSGIIAPGMPNVAIELGEKFGRLMNYGDGLYGGQLVGSLYTAAYFEQDPVKIIEKALQSIPSESHYATCVRDVLSWYKQNPDDWQKTWKLIEEKYHHDASFQRFAEKSGAWIPIDAKLNGAYIIMGLLYGQRDMDSTIVISMRGGKDSDCNPSNAAGVLATTIGYKNLHGKFKEGLDFDKKFSYSEYNLNDLFELTERFTRQYIIREGGRIEIDKNGDEYFFIPESKAVPSIFLPSYDPGPVDADSMYTEQEMKQIEAYSIQHFKQLFEQIGVAMEVRHCGKAVEPEIIKWGNKDQVVATTPMSNTRGIKMYIAEKNLVPAGKEAMFTFSAGHKTGEKWRLRVRKGRDFIIDTVISDETSAENWQNFSIDISDFAGQENINMLFLIENIDNIESTNYWSDFGIQLK